MLGGFLCAQEARAQAFDRADFTFRRVKPPEPGASKRITVQIDPEEQARRLAAIPPKPEIVTPPQPGPVAPASGAYAWYWSAVSPSLTDGAGRFPVAIDMLTQGPDGPVSAPRLQQMQEIARVHGTDILKATIGTQVSPALVLAVIGIESSGRTDAVSPKGAQGLMQLIPATATRFGVDNSKDASQNIRGGVAYLDWLMREFDRDPLMVLAGYNAGEGAVKQHGGVPPYAETRAYVPKVLAAWQVARGLCVTPPELVSDGCVFRVGSSG